eukprot:6203833-Pleurochrysis_carterae.AAC.3
MHGACGRRNMLEGYFIDQNQNHDQNHAMVHLRAKSAARHRPASWKGSSLHVDTERASTRRENVVRARLTSTSGTFLEAAHTDFEEARMQACLNSRYLDVSQQRRRDT